MKTNTLIILLTTIWLLLMVDIIWNKTDWLIEDATRIGNLEVAQYTNQIMVVSVSGERCVLCLYERGPVKIEQKEDLNTENLYGTWRLILETEAIIGKNGLGKTKEGDGKTPVGTFRFTKAFGIKENPGALMEYIQVDDSHYWVDDANSKYYNQFISTKEIEKDWASAEHICAYKEAYAYALSISFNEQRIPGAGSAVFLHCETEGVDVTAGCIAIPEVYMREIIKIVRPECVIVIDKAENILNY